MDAGPPAGDPIRSEGCADGVNNGLRGDTPISKALPRHGHAYNARSEERNKADDRVLLHFEFAEEVSARHNIQTRDDEARKDVAS